MTLDLKKNFRIIFLSWYLPDLIKKAYFTFISIKFDLENILNTDNNPTTYRESVPERSAQSSLTILERRAYREPEIRCLFTVARPGV